MVADPVTGNPIVTGKAADPWFKRGQSLESFYHSQGTCWCPEQKSCPRSRPQLDLKADIARADRIHRIEERVRNK